MLVKLNRVGDLDKEQAKEAEKWVSVRLRVRIMWISTRFVKFRSGDGFRPLLQIAGSA